jgi:hypothetical protein
MTETTKTLSKKSSRKEMRKRIYGKLAEALAEFKAGLKEKRFAASLKRASKILAGEISKAAGKKKTKEPKKKMKAVQAKEAS